MAYRLNKTNGELLVELADGTVDTTSSGISLVGRNYKGWGEAFNENFVRLTENFANTLQPDNPITGQLWYDTNEAKLKVYDGTVFLPAGSPVVSANRPELTLGNLWIDNSNRQLYFYDGNQDGEYTLVGPDYNVFQGKSGFEVVSVIDITERSRTILLLYIGNSLFSAFTDATFRLTDTQKIAGYPDDPNDTVFPRRQLFTKGFNLIDDSIVFGGVAENAISLIDSQGNTKTASDFLSSSGNTETTGTLTIQNSFGLLLGNGSSLYSHLRLVNNNITVLRTLQENTDIALQTISGSNFRNAVYINGATERVGIFQTNPQAELDVEGDLRVSQDAVISGNLIVNGNATYVNVEDLRIQDKNIQLGIQDNQPAGDDSFVDGAGITVKSSDSDKELFYDNDTEAWTSNLDFNLLSNHSYKIDGIVVMNKTAIGASVTKAPGLNQIGELEYLDVDNLSFDGNTISTETGGLIIDPKGNISASFNKITDLTEPDNAQDAANKDYVDTSTRSIPVVLSLDTTGLDNPSSINPYNDVLGILESISPASEKENAVPARIHCVSYFDTQLTGIDISNAVNITNESVIKAPLNGEPIDVNDYESVSVVKDNEFNTISTDYNITPNRQNMTFETINGSWVWISTD